MWFDVEKIKVSVFMLDYTRDGMEIATVMPQVPASVPVPRN
jgi:hypothetical protein